MIVNVYSKRGNISSSMGLVAEVHSYEDDFFPKPFIEGEEITKDEYLTIMELYSNPSMKRGFLGVVNDEGYAKYLVDREKYPHPGDFLAIEEYLEKEYIKKLSSKGA